MEKGKDKSRMTHTEKRLNDCLGKDAGKHWSEKALHEMTERFCGPILCPPLVKY